MIDSYGIYGMEDQNFSQQRYCDSMRLACLITITIAGQPD